MLLNNHEEVFNSAHLGHTKNMRSKTCDSNFRRGGWWWWWCVFFSRKFPSCWIIHTLHTTVYSILYALISAPPPPPVLPLFAQNDGKNAGQSATSSQEERWRTVCELLRICSKKFKLTNVKLFFCAIMHILFHWFSRYILYFYSVDHTHAWCRL